MDKSIMPECYADTLLIEALVPSEKGYNHQMGCFRVEAEMKLGKLKDKFAVGIIDNDKKQIKYLRDFEPVDTVEGSLILWKHRDKSKSHFIIQICPALEKWILEVCRQGSIDLNKFGLTESLDDLKKYTKSQSSLQIEKLKKLFREIATKENIREVSKLKSWIQILKEKHYRVDINELKNA